MSYDIRLVDPVTKETLRELRPHQIRGGTYVDGGTNELWLNITGNYWPIFRAQFGEDGIRSIYGKTGAETIPMLSKAISNLADDVDDNYWVATEGNAKRALCGLLAFAQMRPDGIWNGD